MVNDQFGAPTFAGFIAGATAQMLEQTCSDDAARRRAVNGGTLHLVNAGTTSWCGFASEIFASDSVRQRVRAPRLVPIKSSEFPTRARRPGNSRLSTEKAHVWKLQVPDWRESLADCLSQFHRSAPGLP